MKSYKNKTFQDVILTLQKFWSNKGCAIILPTDISVGAGTFHPQSFFGTLGKKPISIAFAQASRRPIDSRFGNKSNRLQHYYQFQIIIKPAPKNIHELFLCSLKQLKIDTLNNDIQFIEDNWENPTLGAWGIGWEVRLNGMEITQITYFQQMGTIECSPITMEITYGLERIVMNLQNKKNIYEIIWKENSNNITYDHFFLKNEQEHSKYNFENANINFLINIFQLYIRESENILEKKLLFPAYELLLHANHTFNLLDSRKAISITERQNYILQIRDMTKKIAELFLYQNNY